MTNDPVEKILLTNIAMYVGYFLGSLVGLALGIGFSYRFDKATVYGGCAGAVIAVVICAALFCLKSGTQQPEALQDGKNAFP